MSFYTEKQTEAWLTSETRDLPMPDGGTLTHTAFNLVWKAFDALILLNGYSRLRLVEFALEEIQLQDLSFDQAFTCVVGYLDNQHRDAWGI